ncbi:Formate dehydrogenase, partial [Candida africana]
MALYSGGKHAKEESRLLGTVENELGIRKLVEEHGYELITTADKEPSPNSDFDENLQDTEINYHYSVFPSLYALNERGIAVLEVTGSNCHAQATTKGTWDIAAVAKDEFDMKGKVFASIGAGRIGYRILERLVAFNPKKLLYYDYQPLPEEAINKLNVASKLFNGVDNIVERVEKLEDLVSQADVVTINCPLYENALTDPQAIADAINSGHIAYGGDVWPVQPAPKDMPWRTMHNPYGKDYGNAMTVHVSGTSLDAQARYANGVKQILTEYFNKTYNYRPQDVIIIDDDYATKAYGQRSKK